MGKGNYKSFIFRPISKKRQSKQWNIPEETKIRPNGEIGDGNIYILGEINDFGSIFDTHSEVEKRRELFFVGINAVHSH